MLAGFLQGKLKCARDGNCMNNDLKWSEYDFTQIPFNDIVQVGQRTLLYRDIFTVSWLLGRFCNYR
jgi:hypothetical protein